MSLARAADRHVELVLPGLQVEQTREVISTVPLEGMLPPVPSITEKMESVLGRPWRVRRLALQPQPDRRKQPAMCQISLENNRYYVHSGHPKERLRPLHLQDFVLH